ncbi:hypothetical protein TcasGA2_TC011856 [Tribolium castaneum]|uniref:Uncharacterized protein n=1 Tax=Tribolium castaneum TaxID=7070 RepID=D6WZD7_TRICA|nr:hypothetical protein TcasGA2_TC011856 [Tribolium castaneum]
MYETNARMQPAPDFVSVAKSSLATAGTCLWLAQVTRGHETRQTSACLLVRDNGCGAGRRTDVPPLPLLLFIQKTDRLEFMIYCWV